MIKRSIISTLLNGMNAHKNDDTMMRNGCLTLCQFKIPQDVVSINTGSWKRKYLYVITNCF